MGLVRKTFSVATLGAVSFRSKKERLRRAERALRDAEQDLERERSARETAERRIAAAESGQVLNDDVLVNERLPALHPRQNVPW